MVTIPGDTGGLNNGGGGVNDTVESSSSVDPSSSTANTNSSAAPSSDGSLMKQKWISQSQVRRVCYEFRGVLCLHSYIFFQPNQYFYLSVYNIVIICILLGLLILTKMFDFRLMI